MAINEVIDDYAFILVKLAAAKERMIKLDRLMDLTMSKDLDDFKLRLSRDQEDLPADIIKNSKDLEESFRDIFFNYIHMMIHDAPRSCQLFVFTFVQKYETDNLKNLIVGKIANIEEKSIKERIIFQVETILHTDKIIKDALKAGSLEEIIYLYRKTQYYDILRELGNRYKTTKEVFFIHALLDQYYIKLFNQFLHKRVHGGREYGEILKFFVGTLTDFYNLSMVIRGLSYAFEWSEVELLLTTATETFKVKIDDIKRIHKIGDNKEEIVNELKKFGARYPGGDKLVSLIYPDRIVQSLKKFYFNMQLLHLKSFKFQKGNEISQVIAFLLRKEMEIDNLVTVFEGIKNDFDRISLKEYLITEVT